MKTGLTIIKNTSFLLLGRVLSIVLGIVYIGALSRYIHASGIGIIATATALISMTSLLLNVGLNDVTIRDVAINKDLAGVYLPNLFLLRGLLIILFELVMLAIIRTGAYPPETTVVIFIYCLAYIFDELTNICLAIFNAHEQMGYSAALQTGRDLLNIGLSMAAIALKADLYTIVGISALASLTKLVVSLLLIKWKFTWPAFRIDLRLMRKLMSTAMPFAALLTISVLLQHTDTFILSLFRPAQEVGWYSSASLLVNYLLLLPSMFLQAVFPVFAKFNVASPEELKRVYTLSFKYLMILGFALCFGMLVTADQAILLIYGPGFEKAAIALRILSVILFWMFGYANGSFLNATGGQGIATKFAMFGIVLTIGLSLVVTPRFGLVGTALARVLPGALFFLPLTWICFRRLGLYPPYTLAFKTLVSALIMTGAATLAFKNHISLFLVIIPIAPLIYAISLILLGVLGPSDIQLITQAFRREKTGSVDEALLRSRP